MSIALCESTLADDGLRAATDSEPSPSFSASGTFPYIWIKMGELELLYSIWAKAMGGALAALHWKLRTDGADVEFVLGSPGGTEARTLGENALWILDFDCCKPIMPDNSGLSAISRAFWRNDPYYPRPGASNEVDKELWNIFAVEYKRVGKEILSSSKCELVDEAISMIEPTRGKFSAGTKIWVFESRFIRI